MAKSPDDGSRRAIELAAAIDEVIAGKRDSEIDVTIPNSPPRKFAQTGEAATAPTMLRVDATDDDDDVAPGAPRQRSGARCSRAMILVGGAAAMAGLSHPSQRERAEAAEDDRRRRRGIDAAGSGSAQVAAVTPPVAIDAARRVPSDRWHRSMRPSTRRAMPSPQARPTGSATSVRARAAARRTESGGWMRSRSIRTPPRIRSAEGLRRAGRRRGRRRAASPGAPPRPRRPSRRPPCKRATTVREALQLIKDGKRELALASLRALQREEAEERATSRSSSVTSTSTSCGGRVAMDHYQDAIKKNAGYRSNPTLNRNVIRMLSSSKTRQTGHELPARRRSATRPPPISATRPHMRENPVVRSRPPTWRAYIR